MPEKKVPHPAVLARRMLRSVRASLQSTEPETVDKAVEIGGESAAALLVIGMGILGTRTQPISYDVGSESHLTTQSEPLGKISLILGSGTTLAKNTETQWHNSYHHDKTEDEDAYWAQPKNIGISHEQIESTAQQLRDFQLILNRVAAEPIFDLSQEDSGLFYPERKTNQTIQKITAMGAYGLVAGLLGTYEEITARATESLTGSPWIDRERFIKRRTFIKLTAALGTCIAIDNVQKKFMNDNQHLLKDIQSYVGDRVLPNINKTPEENFKRFFGISPVQLRVLYQTNITLFSNLPAENNPPRINLLFNDGDWPKTRKTLIAQQNDMQRALIAFDEYFGVTQDSQGDVQYTIPQDLNDVMKYAWATDQITTYVASKKAEVDLRHVGNAGLALLIFAGAATLSEGIIFPGMDLVADKLKR